MTSPTPPNGTNSEPSLISEHLKMFEPALGVPTAEGEVPSVSKGGEPLGSTQASKQPSVNWSTLLPWSLALVALFLAFSFRGQGTNGHVVSVAQASPEGVLPKTEPSSDQLLAQLLSAPRLTEASTSAASLSGIPAATLSVADYQEVMSRFKGMRSGRYDPFRTVLAPPPLPSPNVPPPPKPEATLPTPKPKVASSMPIKPEVTPSPKPPIQVRMLGVVDGIAPVALVECVTNGVLEKRRVTRDALLVDGYRVAEITQSLLVLHSSDNKVFSLTIGSLLTLQPFAPSASKSLWPNNSALR